MSKKLLLFDLDNTLLTSEETITQDSVEAIKACKARGMLIGYITARARPFKNETFFTEKYNLPRDFIAYYNGAEMYAGCLSTEKIESNVISHENAMKIIRSIRESYPNAKIGVYHEPWSYSDGSGERWHIETREKVKCSILELPRYDVQRIRIEIDKEDDKNKLSEFMTEETVLFLTHGNEALILHKNALKERALLKASEYFNIPLADIIAFGDDVNDMNMLKTAGIGVAVGNALREVKEVADYITETNDNEGVSVWINEYLLKNSEV